MVIGENFIFIHVPKTAGQAVHRSLPRPRKNPWRTHQPLFRVDEETRKNKFAFGFVRNPWDRMVSLYHFVIQKPASRNPEQNRIRSQGFERCILDWNLDSGQIDALWYLDGCDYIGKFESLQTDFDEICDHLKIVRRVVGKINQSVHDDYRKYYTDEMIEIVSEKHKKTIEKFNYTF